MQEQPASSAVSEQARLHSARGDAAFAPSAPANDAHTKGALSNGSPVNAAANGARADDALTEGVGVREAPVELRDAPQPSQPRTGEPVGHVVGRRAPGLTLSETLEIEGVEAPALIDALRAQVCSGALLRALPEGWALDWPEASGSPRLWTFTGAQARRGRGPHMPTDEAAAAGMRLLDATALSLGLGRGHVLPIFENPIRRVIEMEAFCDLPSLDSGSVMDQAAAFLNLGVPVAGVLGLRHEGASRWSGMRPAQRWDKILLSPRGERLRERL
ncbi:MAG: hypothetical protein AAGD12_08370, partial [Pseudomonadota bacterium]